MRAGSPWKCTFSRACAIQRARSALLGEGLEHRVVGHRDVRRIARERRPAERSRAATEERPDELGHETRDLERLAHAAEVGHLAAQVVAVVEGDRAPRLQREHRLDVRAHRVEHRRLVPLGILLPHHRGRLERVSTGDVAEAQVVRRRLVGDDVGRDAAAHELGHDVGDVADEPDRERGALRLRIEHQLQRLVEVRLQPVAVPLLHPAADALGIHVDTEEGGAVHGRGERLRATHAAESAGDDQPPGERAAEVLPRALGEGLVGALQDPLRADVDPAAGRHLAVHREPHRLEAAELVPGGPARHQVRVGDEDPRRLVVGAKDADRLAALHQQGLVVAEPAQGLDDLLEAGPVACRLAAAAVDDQVLGALGHRRIEVVLQHPEGGLLVPAAAGDDRAAGGRENPALGERRHVQPTPSSVEAGPSGANISGNGNPGAR